MAETVQVTAIVSPATSKVSVTVRPEFESPRRPT